MNISNQESPPWRSVEDQVFFNNWLDECVPDSDDEDSDSENDEEDDSVIYKVQTNFNICKLKLFSQFQRLLSSSLVCVVFFFSCLEKKVTALLESRAAMFKQGRFLNEKNGSSQTLEIKLKSFLVLLFCRNQKNKKGFFNLFWF